MGAVYFGNLQLGEHGATRPVPSGVLKLFQFFSPFLGSLRGTAVTKILPPPIRDIVSPGVCTLDVDRSVTMHGLRHKLLSQLFLGSGLSSGSPVGLCLSV